MVSKKTFKLIGLNTDGIGKEEGYTAFLRKRVGLSEVVCVVGIGEMDSQ